MATNEGMFSEKAKVSISVLGGSEVAFETLVDSLSIDQGDKDVEGVPLVGGGRLTKKKPQGDITISFDAYPTTVEGGDSKGIAQLFQNGGTIGGTDPVIVYSSTVRTPCRVTILMTDDTANTGATSTTALNASAMRYSLAYCYCVSANADFSDGYKWSMKFKAPAFNKFGSANVREESTETTGLVALRAFSTTYFDPADTDGYSWTA